MRQAAARRAAEVGVVLGGGEGGRGARQLPSQAAGEVVGGERGPGGGEHGQHGEGVGSPVLAAAGAGAVVPPGPQRSASGSALVAGGEFRRRAGVDRGAVLQTCGYNVVT